jgi:uncharacterized protein (TIGR03083 family)
MSTIVRRAISCTIVGVALPVVVITAPLWILVSVAVDVTHRLFRFPTVRLGLFAVIYLAHEWAGLNAAFVLALAQGAGWRRGDPEAQIRPYRRIQAWWTRSLLGWADRLLGVRFEMPDPASLPDSGFILMSRHASMVDAILPAQVITGHLDRFIHYVLKRELRWVPNIDVYGHRLGNYFVARAGDGDAEAVAIADFAQRTFPGSILTIFPEGTYATPESRARVRESLIRRGDPELAALAHELEHLLPPKPAGSLALLRTQPLHDVVIMGHVGLEGVAQLGGLRRRLPLSEPVVVHWWVHERATIPHGDAERVAWLNQQWRTLDDWVGSVRRAGPTMIGTASSTTATPPTTETAIPTTTNRPREETSMPRLAPDEYRRLIGVESDRLRQVTADDLAAPVPHLEGWTVHNVVGHTGWVCRFVVRCLNAHPDDPPPRASVGEPPVGPAVIDWLTEALDELESALADCDLEAIRPTWTGPQPTSWWLRRIAHELAVHRWDALAPTTTPDPIDAAQALDGIDEVLEVFVPNRMQFDTLAGDGETIHLHTTDIDGGEWMLTLAPSAVEWSHGHAKGDVAARGTASDLLLLLWSRIPPGQVEVFGDQSLLDRWQTAAAF